MKWAWIMDRGGIGDVIATAIVLREFRGRGISIAYATRTWDTGSVWQCLRPGWDYLCAADGDDGTPSDPLAVRVMRRAEFQVNLTPFRASGVGGFYRARREAIASGLGLDPVPAPDGPFNDVEFPTDLPKRPYVVLHSVSAWPEKSLATYEVGAGRDAIEEEGFDVVVVPRGLDGIESLVTLLRHASGAICVDSCVSHLAYWLLPPERLLVIHRDTDPLFLLAGLPNPPSFRVGFDRPSVQSFVAKLKDQPCP